MMHRLRWVVVSMISIQRSGTAASSWPKRVVESSPAPGAQQAIAASMS
jgi:hypothetical protein